MLSYRVINQYGIGGEQGVIVYTPRATGKVAYDRCDKWCRRNDTANTMSITEYSTDETYYTPAE